MNEKYSTLSPPAIARRPAASLLFLGILAALTIVLYWPMFDYAEYKWSHDDNYSHGYFVPIASAYLIWRKRRELSQLPRRENVLGLWVIALALVTHGLGVRADLLRLSMLSFILLLYGFALFFGGIKWLAALLFPIGFLVFAFPLPLYIESITFPMKVSVAKVSVAIMDALGMSILREGTIIRLPTMTIGVADACSGLRSLVLVTGVAAFYAYVFIATPTKRIVFFLLSIPIALVANIARILMTGIVGYHLGAGKVFQFAHDGSGLFVLVVAGICLVLVDSLLAWLDHLRHAKAKAVNAS